MAEDFEAGIRNCVATCAGVGMADSMMVNTPMALSKA